MRDPSEFRERFKAYKDGKSVREIYGLPEYAKGKLPEYEDGDLPDIPGPVTLLGNVARSVMHPKLTIERLMRQSADGTRSFEDVLRAVLLNLGGDYTGYEDGQMHNRDLVDLYLYGNDKGFLKINPADNVGHSYDKEIIASGRNPKDINTYYGKFPVKGGPIILPRYAEQKIRALAKSGIPVTKQLESEPKIGADDVARFLATLTEKNGLPIISYSDMWDFMPDLYANRYGNNFLHYMQAYAADKAGTPFVLRQNVPIKFSDEGGQRIFAGDLNDPDLETQLLLRAGVLPEVRVYPEPRVLTPKLIKEKKAKQEATFQELLKEMSTWKDGKLPGYENGRPRITTGGAGVTSVYQAAPNSKEVQPTVDLLERIANFLPYIGTIQDWESVTNGNIGKIPAALIGTVADIFLPGLRSGYKAAKAYEAAYKAAPKLIDKIKYYKASLKAYKKASANAGYQGVGVYEDILDDLGYSIPLFTNK